MIFESLNTHLVWHNRQCCRARLVKQSEQSHLRKDTSKRRYDLHWCLLNGVYSVLRDAQPYQKEGLLSRFRELFETQVAAEAALEELGWTSSGWLPEM